MLTRLYRLVRRSFSEFLAVPFAEVAAFLVLAWLVSMIDAWAGPRGGWSAWRSFLDSFIGDPEQATQLMSTVATSLVTVSSITFSILLLAVQQSSAALTNQIVDQYMRRRTNQAFFGFFVGSALFALTCLGLARRDAVPVLATSLCLLLAILCLVSLVVLIYSTLDQTRPSSIIATIHDSTVATRDRQRRDLARTRNADIELSGGETVCSERYGYVVSMDVDLLLSVADNDPERLIVLERPLGAPVFAGQEIATVVGGERLSESEISCIRRAIEVARRRQLQSDPMFGVDQLGNIAWTAVSTAKSNPAAALVAIHAINDLLYRWGRDGSFECPRDANSRVVCRDTLMDHLACTYESLMVAASESLQHQSLAEVSKGIARGFSGLPREMQDKLERATVGSLSAMGDHVPTYVLEKEVRRLESAFREAGRGEAADKLSQAWQALARMRGKLASRDSRVAS